LENTPQDTKFQLLAQNVDSSPPDKEGPIKFRLLFL
jgi:hypothetical protein